MELLVILLSGASTPGASGLSLSSAWIEVLDRTLGELSTGITATAGGISLVWIAKLAPLLVLPVVAGLHYLYRHANTRQEKWSFILLVSGLSLTLLGMGMKTWVEGAGFILLFFGWLISSFSATVYCLFVLPDK